MRVSIRDKEPLSEISPAALSAYARAEGWRRTDNYGDSSDVYVSDGLPEIILPRTQRLGDYANVVSQLIEIFADVAGTDELSLYRDLVTADRDVIRVRAAEGDDGAVSVSDGIDLVCGARDMILAAACSLRDPRPVYRAGANKEAMGYVNNIRMGQTEQGSFVVTLLTPCCFAADATTPHSGLGAQRRPDRAEDDKASGLCSASHPPSDRKSSRRRRRRFLASRGKRCKRQSVRSAREVDRTLSDTGCQSDLGTHASDEYGAGGRSLCQRRRSDPP